MITVECRMCGTTIETYPSRIARGNGRYCSRSCRGKSTRTGSRSHAWKGGRRQNDHRYQLIHAPNHPFADVNGYVLEHRLVAEVALGKLLPRSAPVHHVNEDPSDNTPSNLVICDSDSYHKLLHTRTRVQKMGGDPNRDKICSGCKAVKPKAEFSFDRHKYDSRRHQCLECDRQHAECVIRRGKATGERNGSAKLTDRDVSEIRRLRAEGAFQYQIAERFGVSQSQISHIVNFKNWAA